MKDKKAKKEKKQKKQKKQKREVADAEADPAPTKKRKKAKEEQEQPPAQPVVKSAGQLRREQAAEFRRQVGSGAALVQCAACVHVYLSLRNRRSRCIVALCMAWCCE